MKKLILDLDTGVDDALAISYALGSPEIEPTISTYCRSLRSSTAKTASAT